MQTFTIDCGGMSNEADLWAAYLAETNPEGAGYFGANLDAFWDALNGGPGWPGECWVRFVNTDPVKLWRDGRFYEALTEIAADSKLVGIYVE